jgi:hypothetical protein
MSESTKPTLNEAENGNKSKPLLCDDLIDILYIYCRNFDKEWKVLNHKTAKIEHEILIKDGWKHNATIDPVIYIENYLNNINNK